MNATTAAARVSGVHRSEERGMTVGQALRTPQFAAIALTIALSVFTLGALLLLVFGERIGEAVAFALGLGRLFDIAWNVLQWPAAGLLVLTGITLVYYAAPPGRRRWHWVTPGSVFALMAWLAMSGGLRVYVRYFGNYNATYGSIGGVILLMLWFYVSAVVLLVGAEINSEIEHAAAQRGADTREGVKRGRCVLVTNPTGHLQQHGRSAVQTS